MLIANPVYDVVFKYLMSNLDIAKGIISIIIDEEIVSLNFKAQEHALKPESTDKGLLTYYRLDFISKIKLETGGYKNVLIELQKSHLPYDIKRFGGYLGDQYQKEDDVISPDGESEKDSLPIITIYFLGFFLSPTMPPVIKVNRQYINVLTGEEISERSDFIEKLTHNSFIIQIPGLHVELRNRLEYVLSVFQQENFIDDKHRIKSYQYETDDELVIKILKKLEQAAADKELNRKLEIEEMARSEYEATFSTLQRRLKKTGKQLEQSQQQLEQSQQQLEQNRQQLEQKDKLIKELLEKLDKK